MMMCPSLVYDYYCFPYFYFIMFFSFLLDARFSWDGWTMADNRREN